MKKSVILFLVAGVMNLLFTSCEKNNNATPPEIPPLESMKIDFSNFTDNTKASADFSKSTNNFFWAAANVYVFSSVLTSVLVVPVAAFAGSFQHEPVFLGNATWQWEYDVKGFAATYYARMTGQIRQEDVKWEMYLTKEGIGGFEEFKWFEGVSALDRNSGQWMLYHSALYPDEFLRIDWQREGDRMGEVKYTLVRVNDNFGNPNDLFGSYIEAGRTDAEPDAYYNIYLANNSRSVFIEWNTSLYNGRIKDEYIFLDTNWHCWDNLGNDILCE